MSQSCKSCETFFVPKTGHLKERKKQADAQVILAGFQKISENVFLLRVFGFQGMDIFHREVFIH